MSAIQAPKHASTGQLVAANGLSVPVSIRHTDHGTMLTVLEDPGDLYEQPLVELTLESAGRRGLVRSRGTGQRVDDSVIQFFVGDTADIVQRRQYVRVVAAQRVVLHDLEGELVVDTFAVNISGGGMLLSTPRDLELHKETRVKFILYLRDDDEPITGIGMICRIEAAEERVAIMFEEISRRDRERTIRFVFERQRAAIGITRGDFV